MEAQDKKTEILENFSVRLRAAMARRRVTMQQIADKLGVATSTVGAWSQGKNWPQVGIQPTLAAFLGVSTDFLIHGIYGNGFPEDAEISKFAVQKDDGPSARPALAMEAHKKLDELIELAGGEPGRVGWIVEEIVSLIKTKTDQWGDVHALAEKDARAALKASDAKLKNFQRPESKTQGGAGK